MDIQLLYTYHDSKEEKGVAVFSNGARVGFPESWLYTLNREQIERNLWDLAKKEILAGKEAN